MDREQVVLALSALAQPTRLDVFQLLVKHEPVGMPAGEVARQLGVPHNTMSTHLAILARAGLIAAERRSRTILYRASLDRFRSLATYLLKDCCGGHPDICAPLMGELASCRPAREARHA